MRPFRHPIAALLPLCLLPACAGWTTQTVVPQETKRTVYAGEVRVDLVDGSRHYLRGLWVSADSLGGWLAQPSGTEQAFPLLAVARVERRAGEQQGTRGGGGSAHGSGGNALLGMAIGGALGAIGPVIAFAACDHDEHSSGASGCGLAIYGLVVTVPLGMLVGALFGAASGNE